MTVPRFLQSQSNRVVEIHVFTDASTKVFTTCVYARVLQFHDQLKTPIHKASVTPDTSRGEKYWGEKISKKEEQNYDVVDVSLVTAKVCVTPSKTESVSRLVPGTCVITTRM